MPDTATAAFTYGLNEDVVNYHPEKTEWVKYVTTIPTEGPGSGDGTSGPVEPEPGPQEPSKSGVIAEL